jgi:hypothetical protein
MKNNYQKSISALIFFTLTLASFGANAFTGNRTSPLGINTNETMDMDSSVPFINLFKLALPFEEARPWLTKGSIQYDENGWPKNLNGGFAGTRFIGGYPADSIPTAVYNVFYEGQGKIRYGVDARLIKRLPGRDLIEIRPGKNKKISASLTIFETNPNNHLRNIRILMPGGICKGNPFRKVSKKKDCGPNNPYQSFAQHHEELVFNPEYLNFMKDFRVIRLMNMSGITRNPLGMWENRPRVEQATWGGKEGVRGAPLEVMVKLANLTGADPWFSLPHRANNEFIQKYAEYVSANLNPDLKAYIEYSNETWNGVFSQTHHMQNMGERLGLDQHVIYRGLKYYSKRSVEIFKIWETAFEGNNRLVRVMGGMTTNLPMSHMILGYEEAFKHVDALAIAPYFHASQKAQKRINSLDEVFTLMRSKKNRYSVPNTLRIVRQQNRIAAKYGVDLIAYEGGQHLVAYKTHSVDDSSNKYLIQANKDERMAKLYFEFLEGWKKAGGKLFIAFSAPRHFSWIGSWGIKEHIAQDASEAPKYRALMYFQKTNKCWWYACSNSGHVARKSKPKHNPGTYVMNRRFKPGVPTINKSKHIVKATASSSDLNRPVVQRATWNNPSNAEANAINELLNDPSAPNAWE